MPFILKLRDVIVGRSDLRELDPAQRLAHGDFRPGLGWELVEPIFSLRPADGTPASPEQRARYRRARDTLALALFAADGTLIETSRIDVVRDTGSATGLRIDATIVDDAFWRPPR